MGLGVGIFGKLGRENFLEFFFGEAFSGFIGEKSRVCSCALLLRDAIRAVAAASYIHTAYETRPFNKCIQF